MAVNKYYVVAFSKSNDAMSLFSVKSSLLINSGCEVEDSLESELINIHCTSKEPLGEKKTRRKFQFYIWAKNPTELFQEKPTQSGRD